MTTKATFRMSENLADRTLSEKTWYVSPTGSDTTGDGSITSPFLTPQRAYDALPRVIEHQQTIQLADGDYRTSYVPSSEQPRPAVIWGRGKLTTFRSYLSGTELKGPIVIKGNASDNTAVTITTTADYPYGIYNNDGQLSVQDLKIQTSGGNGGSLLTSHRNSSHVYCLNTIADSIFTTRTSSCVTVESGGILEWVDGKVQNGAIGLNTLTSGDNATFSTRSSSIFENCSTAILARNNAYVSLNSLQAGTGKVQIIDSTNTTALSIINSAHVSVRGADGTTDMCQVAGIIDVDNASLELVFSETLGNVILQNGASVKYNASNYQRGIAANGGDVWLATSNSYVSPETSNTDVRPVTLTDGGRINYSGTNNIVGSTGSYTSYNPGALSYTADSQQLSIVKGRDQYRVTSDSGTRIDASIAVSEVEEGRTIYLYANTNAVTFSDGGTMDLGGDITIGQSSGQYTGMTLMMENGQWHLVALGLIRV